MAIVIGQRPSSVVHRAASAIYFKSPLQPWANWLETRLVESGWLADQK